VDAADASADAAPRLERIVCGIDNTAISREAALQARAIGAEGAGLWGVSVWDPGMAMHAGIHAAEVSDDLRRDAVAALRRAERDVPGLEPRLVQGAIVAGMLMAIEELGGDLVAVGSHGRARFAPVIGSVARSMAHHAPCSVLVARHEQRDAFPRRILHAGDGSPEALDAARVAGRIAARTGAEVVTLSVGGDPGTRGLAEASAAVIEECGAEPIPETREGTPHRRIAEVAASAGASLVTVGSRGLTGLKSLGSVGERVASHAPCSVLIVRRTAHPAVEGSAPTTD
jgi:nucleotide-binding universal stress UspA family protein